MFNHLPPVYKGILLALIGYTCFSFSDICAKYLVQYYPVYEVITLDNGAAACFLLIFASRLGGFKDIFRPENFKVHGVRIFLNFCINVILLYCFARFPLADVYTMIFTKPFFAALLAFPLYGEALTRSRGLAIVVGFIGVLIVLRPGVHDFDPLLLLPLATALFIAFMFVCSRSLKKPTPFALGFVPTASACLLTLPLMLMGNFSVPAPQHWWIFAICGVFGALGAVCVTIAFRTAAAAVVAPFLYTEMIWALLFGYFLFGDMPDLWMLGGAAIIIASGIYIVETERRGHKTTIAI